MATDRHIEVDGGVLVADVDGAGPPVVLVHAGICDARQWRGVTERLAGHRTVVRYDRRGYGRSGASAPGTHSAPRDLIALLDGLGLDEVAACGNSFGGLVVLEAAALAPDRFGALVLLAPTDPTWEDWGAEDEAYVEAEEAAVAAGDLDRAVGIDLDYWVRRPEDRELVAAMLREHLAHAREHPWDYEELAPPVTERLGAVRGPVRILVGEHDNREARGMADALAAGLGLGAAEVVPGAGHLIPLERPDVVADAIG